MTPSITAELPEPMSHRVRNAVGRFVLGVAVLGLAIAVSPGLQAESPLAVVVAAVWCALVGSVLRPVLVRLVVPLGWWGAFVLALFANAIVMYIGIELAPGIEDDGFLSIFIASWIYAVLAAVFEWLLLSDADDAFLAYAIRMAGRRKETVPVSTVPGVLFVQLDGVPYPVLDLGDQVGHPPEHLAVDPQRLAPRDRVDRQGAVHDAGEPGRHPARDGAGDAGVPLVREGRLAGWSCPTARRMRAMIESRVSDGRGLLADDGVAISNLFSGDAADEPADDERDAARCAAGSGPLAVVRGVLRPPVRVRRGPRC